MDGQGQSRSQKPREVCRIPCEWRAICIEEIVAW